MRHIALDIGGSLIKLVYFSPDNPDEATVTNSEEGADDGDEQEGAQQQQQERQEGMKAAGTAAGGGGGAGGGGAGSSSSHHKGHHHSKGGEVVLGQGRGQAGRARKVRGVMIHTRHDDGEAHTEAVHN